MCEQKDQYSILHIIRQTWRVDARKHHTCVCSFRCSSENRAASASLLCFSTATTTVTITQKCSEHISDSLSHRSENFPAGICWHYVSWLGKTEHQRACVEFKNHRVRKAAENEGAWGPEWSRQEVEYTPCSVLLHKECIQKKKKTDLWCLYLWVLQKMISFKWRYRNPRRLSERKLKVFAQREIPQNYFKNENSISYVSQLRGTKWH